jgi:hypothetical protein
MTTRVNFSRRGEMIVRKAQDSSLQSVFSQAPQPTRFEMHRLSHHENRINNDLGNGYGKAYEDYSSSYKHSGPASMQIATPKENSLTEDKHFDCLFSLKTSDLYNISAQDDRFKISNHLNSNRKNPAYQIDIGKTRDLKQTDLFSYENDAPQYTTEFRTSLGSTGDSVLNVGGNRRMSVTQASTQPFANSIGFKAPAYQTHSNSLEQRQLVQNVQFFEPERPNQPNFYQNKLDTNDSILNDTHKHKHQTMNPDSRFHENFAQSSSQNYHGQSGKKERTDIWSNNQGPTALENYEYTSENVGLPKRFYQHHKNEDRGYENNVMNNETSTTGDITVTLPHSEAIDHNFDSKNRTSANDHPEGKFSKFDVAEIKNPPPVGEEKTVLGFSDEKDLLQSFHGTEKIVEEPEVVPMEDLVECFEGCGRFFTRQALKHHEKACKKIFQTKQKAFNIKAKRVEPKNHVPGALPNTYQISKLAGKNTKKESIPKWKADSAQLRITLKNKRVKDPLATENEALVVNQPSKRDDQVTCHHCSKHFHEKTADKHISSCAKQTGHKGKPADLVTQRGSKI